ncbi:MAG: hypothetical protein GDA56_13510 [Hormoscilla sp. GM7CHS1pb]|nr:hypothetical protein [Hormoscilla sp. GM7CHS1pb]
MATFLRGLDYIKEIVPIGSNMGGLKTMLVRRRSPIASRCRHRYFNLPSESEQLSELLNATTHLFGRKILINLDRAFVSGAPTHVVRRMRHNRVGAPGNDRMI